jgi:hypothetical protein
VHVGSFSTRVFIHFKFTTTISHTIADPHILRSDATALDAGIAFVAVLVGKRGMVAHGGNECCNKVACGQQPEGNELCELSVLPALHPFVKQSDI